MTRTLALDPGNCSGWANGEGSTLTACGVCSITDVSLPFELWPDVLVIELPQVYPGPQKSDPNDLIVVAVNHGQWRERIAATEVRTPHPKQWKGSVPKDIHGRRIVAALTAAERARLPKISATQLHNAIDAVGMFLWSVGRMQGGR